MKHIICRIDKCLGCSSCELACALEHSQSKNLPEAIREPVLPKARIHVELIDEQGTMLRYRTFALQCRHCDDPVCVQACISGGIQKNEDTGDVQFDSERCVGCWSCIMVCPFGAIVKHNGLHRAIKCDHCPGREIPACIEACPTHALVCCEKEDYQADWLLK
ncbi:MAG: 4Fe-4S dicluster domain-containing protein [Bacteroidota bacterium]